MVWHGAGPDGEGIPRSQSSLSLLWGRLPMISYGDSMSRQGQSCSRGFKVFLLNMCSLGTMVGCLIFCFLNAEGGSKGWVIGPGIGVDGSVIQRELFLDLLP